MDFDLTPAERDFREEVRTWLEEHLVGEFAGLRGRGGMGQEDIPAEQQIAWERQLAGGGWLGIDFPRSSGRPGMQPVGAGAVPPDLRGGPGARAASQHGGHAAGPDPGGLRQP